MIKLQGTRQEFISEFLEEFKNNSDIRFRSYCKDKLQIGKYESFPNKLYNWLNKYDVDKIYEKRINITNDAIMLRKVEVKRVKPTTANITISYCGETITLPTNVEPQILSTILRTIKEGTQYDI